MFSSTYLPILLISFQISLFTWDELVFSFDSDEFVFLDDFLDVEGEEAIEGGNLLRHESVLPEVSFDDGPGILLVNFLGELVLVEERGSFFCVLYLPVK